MMDVQIQDLIDRTMQYHMEGIDEVHVPYFEWVKIRDRLIDYYKPLAVHSKSFDMQDNGFLFNGIKFVAILN